MSDSVQRHITRRGFAATLGAAAMAAAAPGSPGPAMDELHLDHLTGTAGVSIEPAFEGTPTAAGVLKQYKVALPNYEIATYFAAYQKYDPVGAGALHWPDGANRVQPLAVRDFRDLTPGGLFLLVKLRPAGYLAVLPLTGQQTVTWFTSSDAELILNLGTLGTESVRGDLPRLAWAKAESPYSAARSVWETALHHPLIRQSARLREQKDYPEIFRYLGWCSWEQYKGTISQEILLGAVDGIERSGLPIRWMLVDDGHLDQEKRKLLSFHPNSKFPRGWEPILSRRRKERIRWMGVWLNFNGYWNGVDPQNHLGALNTDLAPIAPAAGAKTGKTLQPKPGLEHSFAFYNGMIGAARKSGFDFVKVDNQAHNLALYRGSAQPVRDAAENSMALEMACAFHMSGLINCMAHGPVNMFHTRVSAVTRCSEDYKLGNLARAKRHLHNSYSNMLWLGPTVWGDHDMFHSDDPVAGRMMAVSKALSGGPVYLSDDPARFAAEHIHPLCFSDGELLRPLAPAIALPESLSIDPFAGEAPFRAVAPLPNASAAIAVYNLTEPEAEVTGYAAPEDYAHAGLLLTAPETRWDVPAEGLVVYDWYGKTAGKLAGAHKFSMPHFSDRLLLLCPVRDGWAVIGRPDKFLSPAGVEVLETSGQELLVRMKEPGPLLVWQGNAQAVHSPDCRFERTHEHLWQANVTGTGLVRVQV